MPSWSTGDVVPRQMIFRYKSGYTFFKYLYPRASSITIATRMYHKYSGWRIIQSERERVIETIKYCWSRDCQANTNRAMVHSVRFTCVFPYNSLYFLFEPRDFSPGCFSAFERSFSERIASTLVRICRSAGMRNRARQLTLLLLCPYSLGQLPSIKTPRDLCDKAV